MIKIEFGSISEATLRTEDLLKAFADKLGWIIDDNKDEIDPEDMKAYKKILDDVNECYNDDGDLLEEKMDDAEWLVNNDLFDALNALAMPYQYFGSNEGDGADFGFWFSYESFEDDKRNSVKIVESIKDVKDMTFDEVEGTEYFATVTDHGNVTLYDVYGNEIWALV